MSLGTVTYAPASAPGDGGLDRLGRLFDRGSVAPVPAPGSADRVVGASGSIGGRAAFAYLQDGELARGAAGEARARTIVRIMRMAEDAGVPVVGIVEATGARIQETIAGLGGYRRILREKVALARRIPHISIISGDSAEEGSYSPPLTDFVVMTEQASMFLTGPRLLRAVTGEDTTCRGLGGCAVHERNGVCHFAVRDEGQAAAVVRDLLGHLPQNAWERPPRRSAARPATADPARNVPSEHRRIYDIRDVMAGVLDRGRLLELSPKWARNLVCGFGHLDGRSVGVIANQPRYLGGVLDGAASEKGRRFVNTCDTFGLPLIVLVDTPGFMPGSRQEMTGIIRHGAGFLGAFARAAVPRVTLILRQAYGGAYITMNAKDLGADFVYAWPGATIGIMSADQAVDVLHGRELAESADPGRAKEMARAYRSEHQTAQAAAAAGFLDQVVAPRDTRASLIRALDVLDDKAPRRSR